MRLSSSHKILNVTVMSGGMASFPSPIPLSVPMRLNAILTRVILSIAAVAPWANAVPQSRSNVADDNRGPVTRLVTGHVQISTANLSRPRGKTRATPSEISLKTVPETYLTITGEISPKGVLLHSAVASSKDIGIGEPPTPNDYAVRLHIANGKTLLLPFFPRRVADGIEDPIHFSVTLPHPGEISRVEVLHQKRSLPMRHPKTAQHQVSPSANSAKSKTFQTATSSVRDGRLLVTWNNTQEPFMMPLYVAPDETITVLGVAMTGGTASIDISNLPKGGHFELSFASHINARLEKFAY